MEQTRFVLSHIWFPAYLPYLEW